MNQEVLDVVDAFLGCGGFCEEYVQRSRNLQLVTQNSYYVATYLESSYVLVDSRYLASRQFLVHLARDQLARLASSPYLTSLNRIPQSSKLRTGVLAFLGSYLYIYLSHCSMLFSFVQKKSSWKFFPLFRQVSFHLRLTCHLQSGG